MLNDALKLIHKSGKIKFIILLKFYHQPFQKISKKALNEYITCHAHKNEKIFEEKGPTNSSLIKNKNNKLKLKKKINSQHLQMIKMMSSM